MYPPGYPTAFVAGNAVSLSLFIAGKPVPKGRPRARAQAGKDGGRPWAQVYNDAATVNWEEHVAWQVKEQLARISIESGDDDDEIRLPFQARVLAVIRFNFERPKSTPQTVEYPVKSRTDVDNLAKAILDALQNAKVLSNDNIVTDLMTYKRYTSPLHPEGVEIDITALQ